MHQHTLTIADHQSFRSAGAGAHFRDAAGELSLSFALGLLSGAFPHFRASQRGFQVAGGKPGASWRTGRSCGAVHHPQIEPLAPLTRRRKKQQFRTVAAEDHGLWQRIDQWRVSKQPFTKLQATWPTRVR